MRKQSSMTFVIGGLAVGGALFGGMAWAAKKKKAVAQQTGALPAGARPTEATPALYPVPPIPQVPPTGETAVQQRVVAALQTQNPAEMRRVAGELRNEGYTQAAGTLESYAAGTDMSTAVVQGALNQVAKVLGQPVPAQQPAQPMPSTTPTTPATPAPVPPPPPPGSMGPPETPRQPVPEPMHTEPAAGGGTNVTVPGIPGLTNAVTYTLPPELTNLLPGIIQAVPTAGPAPAPAPVINVQPQWPETDPTRRDVATRMNMNLAASSKGKENQALVRQFQTQEAGKAGKVDGLYGPTVAKDLGERYGIIPAKPMYWSSKTSAQSQKNAYNAWLSEMAAKDPVRVNDWGSAAVF